MLLHFISRVHILLICKETDIVYHRIRGYIQDIRVISLPYGAACVNGIIIIGHTAHFVEHAFLNGRAVGYAVTIQCGLKIVPAILGKIGLLELICSGGLIRNIIKEFFKSV